MALSAYEVLLGVPRLETLFQSISAMLLTKLKQNQSDIVAEVYYNKLDHAQSTGHLLESCLRRFEKVTINYPALVYSNQTVTAFINELWLRGLCSTDTFAVLRIFQKYNDRLPQQEPPEPWKSLLSQQKMLNFFW